MSTKEAVTEKKTSAAFTLTMAALASVFTVAAATVPFYICYQARRVANSFVKNADIKIANDTSIAESTQRIAVALERVSVLDTARFINGKKKTEPAQIGRASCRERV